MKTQPSIGQEHRAWLLSLDSFLVEPSTPISVEPIPSAPEVSEPPVEEGRTIGPNLTRKLWDSMTTEERKAWVRKHQRGRCGGCGSKFRFGGEDWTHLDDFDDPRKRAFPVYEHSGGPDTNNDPSRFRSITHRSCNSTLRNVERPPKFEVPRWREEWCRAYLVRFRRSQPGLHDFG